MASVNGEQSDAPTLPRSIRHKRILEWAADHPDASLEDIATEIPTATVELVENVLEEYGDPAEDHGTHPTENEPTTADADVPSAGVDDPTNDSDEPSEEQDITSEDGDLGTVPAKGAVATPGITTDGVANSAHNSLDSELPRLSALTDRQRETLSEIAEHPEATQREIGEILDVSAATVCNRVDNIPGIDWKNRSTVVADLQTGDEPMDRDTSTEPRGTQDDEAALNHLDARVKELETRFTNPRSTEDTSTGLDDPELAAKVVHACLHSDMLSEDEELQLLKNVLR